MKVAEQILTRTLGETPRQEVTRPNITIIGIQGITNEDIMKLTQPPPDEHIENITDPEMGVVEEVN